MPKNAPKTGKSSKTARVLSLLTDPAASLLGGSRNHTEDDNETAATTRAQTRGLDDVATESRIQASLAAEEDSLVSELFGKKEPPRPRPAAVQEQTPEAPRPAAPPAEPAAPEPDPRTLELLSMLSNPSTLGNSAMPPVEEGRPVTLDMDFADELTAGMPEQPKFQREPEPEPEPEPPAVKPYVPQQFTQEPAQQQPQYVPQPAQQQPQYAPQPAQQQPQYAPQPRQQPQYAPQPQQPQYAPQPARQQPQYAPQPRQQPQYAPQPQQPQYAPQPQQPQYAQQQPQQWQPAQQATSITLQKSAQEPEQEFVCFNLTQAMVENKADKLMKQFGMCTCNRCKVDVTAIALSNLPAKYVATQNRDVLPLLSMYEEKYSAAVTVQVMNACRMVMKRPHHGR